MGSPLGHRTSSMIFHLRQSPSRLQVGALLHAIHRESSGIALLSSTAWPCSSLPLGWSLAVGIKPRRCRSKMVTFRPFAHMALKRLAIHALTPKLLKVHICPQDSTP
ncbi:hypothetical protein Bca4012_005723 [Brassica carinata]